MLIKACGLGQGTTREGYGKTGRVAQRSQGKTPQTIFLLEGIIQKNPRELYTANGVSMTDLTARKLNQCICLGLIPDRDNHFLIFYCILTLIKKMNLANREATGNGS